MMSFSSVVRTLRCGSGCLGRSTRNRYGRELERSMYKAEESEGLVEMGRLTEVEACRRKGEKASASKMLTIE